MVVVEWLNAVWQGFQLLTPAGIQPEYFWSTFLLVFALIYSLLSKVKLFGQELEDRGKAINAIVALVFAYFTASSAFATIIISKIAPNLGMFLVAILSLVIVFSFLSENFDKDFKWLVVIITVIGFMYILWGAFSGIPGAAGVHITTEDWGAIIALGIIIGILAYAFKK